MVFQVAAADDEPRKLTQAVLQITTMLDMFQAELARVLYLRCGDIGQLSSGKRCLEQGTESWAQAVQFVKFYQLLYEKLDGDGVAMRHWMRVEQPPLAGVPHRLIVDDDSLQDVIGHLETL